MKGSELIKRAIESDMPDMEAVQKKCIEELHKEKEWRERPNKKKPNRKIQKSIYAGLGACAALWLCMLNLPAKTDAESWIARLQTWLHLNHERVEVGKMEKNSIRIPEDCEEVEYGGEKYLTKSYASTEELEEDIGKHLKVWRGVGEFEEGDIVLRILDQEYAMIGFFYDFSKGETMEAEDIGNEMQDLRCYITIPLSKDFSMNNVELKDEALKNVALDEKGNLIDLDHNGDYSVIDTYHSAHLDVDISVIEEKEVENIEKKKDADTSYYYLYFVYQGLSYQITCHSNLDTAKFVVEELE